MPEQPEQQSVSHQIARLARLEKHPDGPLVRIEADKIAAPGCLCANRNLYPVLFVSDFEGSPEYPYVVLHRYCVACAAPLTGADFARGETNLLRGLTIRIEWKGLAAVMELLKSGSF